MTEVLPDPAAATTWTRLSIVTTAADCSLVSGFVSMVSKNSRRSVSDRNCTRSFTSSTRARRSVVSNSSAARCSSVNRLLVRRDARSGRDSSHSWRTSREIHLRCALIGVDAAAHGVGPANGRVEGLDIVGREWPAERAPDQEQRREDPDDANDNDTLEHHQGFSALWPSHRQTEDAATSSP